MGVDSWRERAEELVSEIHALSLAARDSRTPLVAKALAALLLAYAVSPVDPIPDFLPGIGYLDELVVLPLGVALALRLVPDDILADCRGRADGDIDAGRVRWIAGGVTVLVWAGVVLLALRTLG